MSFDASRWAWKVKVRGASQRLVLLALADRAGDENRCYPSLSRLILDTSLNRKTIIKVLDELETKKLIKFTGEIKGNGVKVYELIGMTTQVEFVENTVKTKLSKKDSANLAESEINLSTGSNSGTSTKKGTSTSTNNGTSTSTKNGTQNLSLNLSIESKNKKDWLCFKKLRQEIFLIDSNIDFEVIANASWSEREKRAFELYNEKKNLCDELMNYHFADWLVNAMRNKYSDQSKFSNTPRANGQRKSQVLSEKQIHVFAQKLSHHPDFTKKYSEPGDSYDKLTSTIARKLSSPQQAKKWEGYLKQVGFNGSLSNLAA